ncbi:hypothetical protein [Lichenicoccus sp.]|uniref:hypothetical protein n=1 Tax=Lichenicoccus sp. TaxID=2781899 RepID=UPI003D0EA5D8
MPSNAKQQKTDLIKEQNIDDLGRIIASEARGLNETAQAMVGWTVINRMKAANIERVSEVWAHGNYAHDHFPTATSLRIAEGILGDTAMDISQGATHFYTPAIMPKAGEPHAGVDVGGGLETVHGVTKNGRPIQNYRRRWAINQPAVHVPGVQDKDFKFFRVH